MTTEGALDAAIAQAIMADPAKRTSAETFLPMVSSFKGIQTGSTP
jgi:hypothetical protein